MCFWGLRLVFGIAQLGFILIDPRKACDVFLNHYLSNPPRNISLCIWPSYASFRAFQLCFDPKFLCSKRFSTDKARPGSVTILFLAPSRFWLFLVKDQENCIEIDVLDVFYALKRFCVFPRRKHVFSSCECSMLQLISAGKIQNKIIRPKYEGTPATSANVRDQRANTREQRAMYFCCFCRM